MALETLAEAVTPLGDKLVLVSMVGREGLSRPFSYDLVLRSEDTGVKATELLGQSVTVKVELDDDKVRYFNGVVSRFARGGRPASGIRAHHHERDVVSVDPDFAHRIDPHALAQLQSCQHRGLTVITDRQAFEVRLRQPV